MSASNRNNRLNHLMNELGIRSVTLAQASGGDHSLITKWRRGERPLTRRSRHLMPVAKGLIALDTKGLIPDIVAPWQQAGESTAEALCEYLLSSDLPALPPRTGPQQRITSGGYTVQHQVYLGQRGFRSAALAMLDYVTTLPPGREIVVVCHGNYNWMVSDMAFVAAFLEKLQRAFARGTTITLINRKGYAIADIAAFAGPWLIAHLKGHIRSRYYEGEMPGNLRFIASIREYWSARVLEDPEVEDSLFLAMYTDVLDIRREVAECDEYLAISRPLSQYHFLQNPAGTPAEKKLWPTDGCLPGWNDLEAPDGSFFASMRVPGFGVMTRAEFDQVAEGRAPELPAFLFAGDAGFAPGPHKLVLCAEDVQEGLLKSRRMHEALSEVMGQRAFVPQSMLRAQLRRILAAMAQRDDFEVALVPRVAFASLQMDLICWRNSATVAWLQDRTESVYSFDEATSGAFYGFMGFLWGRLMAGWKNQDRVRRQLRRWLTGKGLESTEPDSAIVRGWRLFPMA